MNFYPTRLHQLSLSTSLQSYSLIFVSPSAFCDWYSCNGIHPSQEHRKLRKSYYVISILGQFDRYLIMLLVRKHIHLEAQGIFWYGPASALKLMLLRSSALSSMSQAKLAALTSRATPTPRSGSLGSNKLLDVLCVSPAFIAFLPHNNSTTINNILLLHDSHITSYRPFTPRVCVCLFVCHK